MGRRSEQRIVIAFPVVVRGTDSRGSPFVVTTETHDVSCTGASLRGLRGVVEPGGKIEVECQNQKAWYRVQWASAANRVKEWRTGVRCLEPGKYIWGVPPKEWAPDTFDVAAASNQPAAATGTAPPATQETRRERRRFARHTCRIEAQVSTEGAYGAVVVNGKITDISLGGCYVEMLAPLPEETPVEVTFSIGQAPLHLAAKVCTAQHGFGMGLSFTGMSPDDFEALRQFAPPAKDPRKRVDTVPYAAPRAGTEPQARAPSSQVPDARESAPDRAAATRLEIQHAPSAAEFGSIDLPEPAIAIEALIRLLLRKKIVSLAELLQELERLKTTQT
jgi:PilZ domain